MQQSKWGLFVATIGSIVMIYGQASQNDLNSRLGVTGVGILLIIIGFVMLKRTKKK